MAPEKHEGFEHLEFHQKKCQSKTPPSKNSSESSPHWLKMYDKAGLIGRVETVINSPAEFRIRRRVQRRGQRATLWLPLRKSVAYLFRSGEIALQSNSRYLNALAQVDDPTCGVSALDAITTRKRSLAPRPLEVFNPLAAPTTSSSKQTLALGVAARR